MLHNKLSRLTSISFIKTVYANIKYYYIPSIKNKRFSVIRNLLSIKTCLPIIVFRGGEITVLGKGEITFPNQIKSGLLKIGINSVPFCGHDTLLEISGRMEVCDKVSIGRGSYVSVAEDAILRYKGHFCSSGNDRIICDKYIEFGDSCMLSWDVLIMDTDLHNITNQAGVVLNPNKPVIIGANVWIGAKCTILKGTTVAKNVIIAANTLVTGTIEKSNTIIASSHSKKELSQFYKWGGA